MIFESSIYQNCSRFCTTMFSRRNITTTLLAVIFATGCGGGSGGGSGSSSGGGKRSISTGIRLMHSSVDAVPVDLFVDGKKVVSANFGETTAYKGSTHLK